jgi:hypothetical protein
MKSPGQQRRGFRFRHTPVAGWKPEQIRIVVTAATSNPNPRRMLRAHRLLLAALIPAAVQSQSLDLMINNTGLSIGDSRLVRGVRLNFRDDRLREVIGINATIWTPYDPPRGVVNGVALGLPLTGARRINGIGLGVFGVGASEEFSGIGAGLFGVGAGGDVRGLLVGGFGVGAGGNVTGITLGGFGAGAGGNVKGITIGGFGAGAGGNISGLQAGIFGVGAGGNVTGISIGGFGAGAGGNVTGLTIGGMGAGAGGDITGITIGGLGAGAGGTLRGFAFGGLGAGAPTVRALVISVIAAGGHDVKGGILAPVWFKVSDDRGNPGIMRGVSVSAFNQIKGEQNGLSIGLLNYAWSANGLQIGVLNYVADNPKGTRLLPLFNRSW